MRAGLVDQGGDAAVRQGSIGRQIWLLVAAAAAALLLAMGMGAPDASATETTTFGGNPGGELTPGLDCEVGAPGQFEGRETCLWEWAGPTAGDGTPFPEATGGSGTVTSVTLPAMPNPGPMEAVVLTGTVTGGGGGYTNYYCCKIVEISPQFTVPANQETTIPLDLAVSNTATGNIEGGEAPSYDGVGISVLGPQYSVPLHYTGRTLIGEPGGADRDNYYAPAPTTTSNGEYVKDADPTGYELMAKFTLETGIATPAPAPMPVPTPAPAPAAPAPPDGGLKLGGGTLTAANLAGPLTLGQAQNPPTAATTQTLTVPGATAAAASHKKKSKSKPKPIVVGKGSTTIPAGQTVAIKLTLTSAGRKLLAKKHSLKVTETIVAKNSAGETQTTTRTVTIRLKRKK
jgi:hypothetical protein